MIAAPRKPPFGRKLGRRPERPRAGRAWLALAAALCLPLALGRLAVADWTGAPGWLAGLALGALAAAAPRFGRRALALGLALSLAVFLGLGSLQRWMSARSWLPAEPRAARPVGLTALGTVDRLAGGEAGSTASRSWTPAPGTRGLAASLQARLVRGESGWDWFRSGEGIRVSGWRERGEVFTRALVPRGPDPYLYRTVDTGRPIAGRSFRVRLELRGREAVPAVGCRGVWLQEYGGDFAARCQATPLTRDWAEVELAWVPPPSARSKQLRVVLNDFDGLELEVRRVRLEELEGDRWRALWPLEPAAATLSFEWLGLGVDAVASFGFEPDARWRSYRFEVRGQNLAEAARVEARLETGRGLELEVRDVRLEALGPSPDPEPRSAVPRPSLWFGHPNLAGHSLAAAGLALVLVSRSGWSGALGLGLALAAIALTESRAAWLAALLGLPWLLWFACRPRERVWAYGLLLALGAALALGRGDFGRLGNPALADGLARPVIWRVAWDAFLDHPWSGLGPNAFAAHLAARAEAPEPIPHAHNLWLDFAASYGLPGLAGVTAFTAGLLALAWRRGRFRGLALVVPVLAMNVFDPSLFFPGVACPLYLGLNALPERPEATGEGV